MDQQHERLGGASDAGGPHGCSFWDGWDEVVGEVGSHLLFLGEVGEVSTTDTFGAPSPTIIHRVSGEQPTKFNQQLSNSRSIHGQHDPSVLLVPPTVHLPAVPPSS